jgi:hypothetical protein
MYKQPIGKKSTLGGQERTAMMPCGKIMKGHPRGVDSRILLHQKVCSVCADVTYTKTPFTPDGNNKDNIRKSRNGNVVKATHKMIKGVNGDGCLTFKVDGTSTDETLKKMVADPLTENKE